MLRAVERFLLPNECICCGRLVPARTPDDLVCGVCLSRMRAVGTGCSRCRHPLPPVGPCRFCAAWTEALIDVNSAVWLDRESRVIIHQLKYGHARRLATLIGDVVVGAMARPTAAVVVPVPVGPQRFRERGYNQAALIGAQLAARWGLTFLPRALRRGGLARSQTSLTPAKRRSNVSSEFEARELATPDVGQQPVLIVDDVLTTGATVDACARALVGAGWKTIRAVTFARAKSFELQAVGY